MINNTLRIGTRASQLALWQANWIKGQLIRRHPHLDIEIIKIKTTGDKILDVPLAKVGGKGLFVKEIENALLDGSIDLAVHSMKDVPTKLPEGLGIVAVSEREDPRDALLSREGVVLDDLSEGSRIGTSSLRRQAQILNRRPDFHLEPLRGNINTRLRKLKDGLYDAIILAHAGVKRLGWDDEVTEVMEPEVMLPAIGQGALGIEARVDDQTTLGRISFLNHPETSVCVTAERAFLKRLEGGCQVPVAAYATVRDGEVSMKGLVAGVDGVKFILRKSNGSSSEADSLGRSLAEQILDAGGREILEEVYGSVIS